MRAHLFAREQTESDDESRGDPPGPAGPGSQREDAPKPDRYRPHKVLRIRCYACAGTGRLEVIDDPSSRRAGRLVPCIACRGSGRILVE